LLPNANAQEFYFISMP